MRDEGLDRPLALADQQGKLARLPEIVSRHRRLSVDQHALCSPTGKDLDRPVVDVLENVGHGATPSARLRHMLAKCIENVASVAAALRERLAVSDAPAQA